VSDEKVGDKFFASRIIFAFEFHCKRMLLFIRSESLRLQKPSQSQNESRHGNETRPFASMHQANEGEMNSRMRYGAPTASRIAFVLFAFAALSACEQNSFVPPPPPKVDVAVSLQRAVTRYLEATGNTAPINSVDLVARVQACCSRSITGTGIS
jgi:hypothetical protein